MLKVKISSCVDGRTREADEFSRLYSACKEPKVELVDSYENADVVFVTDLHHRNIYADVIVRREHRANYNKLICYSEADFPPDKLPGIYTCGSLKKRSVRGAPFYFWFKNHESCSEENIRADRPYIFSFMGRNCSKVRGDILGMSVADSGVMYYIENTTKSYPFFNAVKSRNQDEIKSQKAHYNDVMSKSKFVLAPRGTGLSSFRQYEAMVLGCVPVVLSDDLRQPEFVNWEKCSVKIAESDVNTIPRMLKALEPKFDSMSMAAKAAYKKLMDPACYWKYIEDSIISIYENNMDERKPMVALYGSVVLRAVRRTIYRRKNDIKRFVNRGKLLAIL